MSETESPGGRTHWHDRWDSGQLGFHVGEPNGVLVRHLGRLESGRIFVPLCGKTLDLWFLVEAGFAPVGAELVPKAVDELFAERGIEPEIDGATHRGGGIEVVLGDVFETGSRLGEACFDSIWDRAALIALPPPVRARYAELLRSLLRAGGTMLLDTLAYDQSLIDGPPWSVPDDEVRSHYESFGALEKLDAREAAEIPPKMTQAGVVAMNTQWLWRKT